MYSSVDNATEIHIAKLVCYEPLSIMTQLMSEHCETCLSKLSHNIIHTANIFLNIDVAANKYLEVPLKKVRYITMPC